MYKTTRWTLLCVLAASPLASCDATPPEERAASPAPSTPTATAPAESPAEALADVLRERDAYERARRLAVLLPELGPDAVPAVKRNLDRLRHGLGATEFELLVRFWASNDPEKATMWAYNYPGTRLKYVGIDTAVSIWAEADPPSALAGVMAGIRTGDVAIAQTTHLALVRGWFETNRPGLEDYIYGLGSGILRQRALLGYALALQNAGGSEALVQWAEAIPAEDERYKLSVYRQVTSALAWADPAAAQRWCDAHCEGPYGKGMLGILVRARLHSGENGADIIEWLARSPEGERRDQALGMAYEIWALKDRDAALRWMAEKVANEPEPWVDLLYGSYARQLAVASPAKAIQWAERVEPPQAREAVLERIARRWLKKDPEAAEAWLVESSLSEETRERARNLSLPDYIPEETP